MVNEMALKLTLHSPTGSEPVTFQWPPAMDIKDCAKELIDTMKFVCEDMPEIRHGLKFNGCQLDESSIGSNEDMEVLCERFNNTVRSIFKLRQGQAQVRTRPSSALLKHILQLCYNRSVSEPDKLNQYEPFSPEVYGETSFDLVTQIVESAAFTPKDIFIDLGSGVGQVVLQVAACTECEMCYGIEKADRPAKYAQAMQEEFIKWMKWYGKTYSKFLIEQGDFLEEHFRERISEATIVFVNNFAFGPQVDHQLKIRFANLKEGSRIISSKAFCPLNFRITDRNLTDISCMMRVEELSPLSDAVSWTDKPFTYFIHTMDSSLMAKYFHRLRHPELYKDEDQSRDRRRRDDVSSEGSSRQASVSRSSSTATLHSAARKIAFPEGKTERGRSAKCAATAGKRHNKSNGQLVKSSGSRVTTAKSLISRARAAKTKSPSAGREPTVAAGGKKRKMVANGYAQPSAPAIDQLLTAVRHSYAFFKRHMHTPEYRQQLELKVKAEQERSEQLQLRVSQLERQIACLQKEGDGLLDTCLRQIGLDGAKCPEDLFSSMQRLIDDIHRNNKVVENLECDVTQLECDKESLQTQIQQYAALNNNLACTSLSPPKAKAKRSPRKQRAVPASSQLDLATVTQLDHSSLTTPFESPSPIGCLSAAASSMAPVRTLSLADACSYGGVVSVAASSGYVLTSATPRPSAFCAINASHCAPVNGLRVDAERVNHSQPQLVVAVRQPGQTSREEITDVNGDDVAETERCMRRTSRDCHDVVLRNDSAVHKRSVPNGQLASMLGVQRAVDPVVRIRATKVRHPAVVVVNGTPSVTPVRPQSSPALVTTGSSSILLTHRFASNGLAQPAVQSLTLPASLSASSLPSNVCYYHVGNNNRLIPVVLAPTGLAARVGDNGFSPVSGGRNIEGLLTAANKQT